MASWISTGIGPFRVGRSFHGNSADPKSPFVWRALGIWFMLVIVTFFTVPVVTAVLIIGLIPLIIACMIAEATYKTPAEKAQVTAAKPAADPGRVLNAGGEGFYDTQAVRLRAQHLAGKKITHRAAQIIAARPDLEFVIYPERRPLDPFPYFTDSDRGWFSRFGDIPEAQ